MNVMLVCFRTPEYVLTFLLRLPGAWRALLLWIVALIAEQREPHAGIRILVHLADRLSRIEIAHFLIPRFVRHDAVIDSSGVV